VNAPLSSGMGRLFDAVAALLGVRERMMYEGQAAIELEQLAGAVPADPYPWRFGDAKTLVTSCHEDLDAGRDRREIAAAFHEAVALEAHGFRVLTYRRVPPNDGGISFGQAAVAAATIT
jgi:hydrogenase maturation protein HypF